VVAGAWIRGDRVLAAQHGPASDRAHEWELPGGKVEAGESDPEALRRELLEELGARVEVRGPPIARDTSPRGERIIDLLVNEVRGDAEPRALEHVALAWIDAATGDALQWSAADARLWPSVRDRLIGGPG